jgi:peptidoglycan/LPS O-acetylase OafA/YrhL
VKEHARPGMPARIDGLETLRALMAIWVLLGHCGNYLGHYLGQQPPAWMKVVLLTSTPVEVFIVLSGFVIFELLRSDPAAGYRPYIARRARRILPVYFFAVALATLCMGLRAEGFVAAPWRTAEELATAMARFDATRLDLGWHLLSHATLLHGLVPESWLAHSAYALLAPAWSLSLEWQFYLLAPLLFMFATRGTQGLLWLVLVLALAGTLLTTTVGPEFTPAFFLVSWPFFALGWWLSALRHRGARAEHPRSALWLSLVPIVAAAVLMAADWRSTLLSIVFALLALPLCWGAWNAYRPAVVLRRALEVRWLQAIGRQSYSLYLLHVLVLDLVGWILIRTGVFGGSDAGNFVLLAGTTLAFSLVASALSYRFVEKPFMRARPRASVAPA